ncbi:MAG: hypothetical protein ACREJB_19440 [Planctomycetaceae bacterium]
MDQTTTYEIPRLDVRHAFPWVHLFRAFRIAIDVRKLLLGAAALLLIAAGDWVFSFLPFAPDDMPAPWPWEHSFGYAPLPLRSLWADPWNAVVAIAGNWQIVLWPLWTVLDPALALMRPDLTWGGAALAWTRLFWAIAVWSVFGGAITRMAAVKFARDESLPMRSALKFSLARFLSFFSAPLLPLAGIGFLWLLGMLGGLIGRIPAAGEPIVGALWVLPLLLAFAMALIVLALAVSWPLMSATISAEGSDAFDGFSRSFGFIFSRPWYALWLAIVALVYGSAVIFFVSAVTTLVAYLAEWSVSAGAGEERADRLTATAPELIDEDRPLILGEDLDRTADDAPLGTELAGFWLRALATLAAGFVASYFWTAVTIMYFLLRRHDDATRLDEVWLPEDDEQDDLLPLVGVAASDQEPIERPPVSKPIRQGNEADETEARR